MDPERGKTRTAAGGRERLDGTLLGERRAARAGRGSWEAAALEAGHRALESAARRPGSSTGRAVGSRAHTGEMEGGERRSSWEMKPRELPWKKQERSAQRPEDNDG
jgi:hypothetical protein